jgi:hypothetical protein
MNRSGAYAETRLAVERARSAELSVGGNVFLTTASLPQLDELKVRSPGVAWLKSRLAGRAGNGVVTARPPGACIAALEAGDVADGTGHRGGGNGASPEDLGQGGELTLPGYNFEPAKPDRAGQSQFTPRPRRNFGLA